MRKTEVVLVCPDLQLLHLAQFGEARAWRVVVSTKTSKDEGPLFPSFSFYDVPFKRPDADSASHIHVKYAMNLSIRLVISDNLH